MSSDSSDTIQVTKIPMLKPDEFELWKNIIKQYMLLTDYMMWDVVVNGSRYIVDGDGVRQPRAAPTTDQERRERATEWKALSTLLLSIPNEYQRNFDKCEDAKVLMEAIEKRFGGNDNTKKNKRSLLKQPYENFTGAKTETLTQIFDRFTKLVGELENHKVKIDKDDLNAKFLRSLGDDWTIYTVGLRQSEDLDEKELEDIYNNLRNFEPEVERRKQAGGYTINAAFASISTSQIENNQSGGVYSTEGSNDQSIESFFAHQNASVKYEDVEQLNPDDLEEMDIKW